MDIIFGAITQEQRDIDIARRVDRATAKADALEHEDDNEKSAEHRTEKV